MASQLLQILQQGIQAKERAQQADIDRGLRELQIGKEEALQRERFTFQKNQSVADRQFELLKLSRQISADSREQSSNQMHELNLEAIDTANEFLLLEEQRRMEREGQFQPLLSTINLEAQKANAEILGGLISGGGAMALGEDTTMDFKSSIDKIFKKIDPIVGNSLYSAYQSAGAGNLKPFEDLMDYLNDNIVMANTVLVKGDSIGLAAKTKAQNIKNAFAAMGIDVDGNFDKTWKAFLKNEEVQSNVRKEFKEMMNYDLYDEKGKLIKETDAQRRERRYSSQRDLDYIFPEKDNEIYKSYQDQLDAFKLLNAKAKENKKNNPKTQEEAFENWQSETTILNSKEEDLKALGVRAKAVFNGDVHDIVEKTFISLQDKNKIFSGQGFLKEATKSYEKGMHLSDNDLVKAALARMKTSIPTLYNPLLGDGGTFLGDNNLMGSVQDKVLNKVFSSKAFEDEFKKQSNLFLQKYPRNEYWYSNQIFGNILPVGKGSDEIKAQTRAMDSHLDAMSFLGILKEGLTAWDAYSKQLGIQRDAFSKTGM